MTITIVIIEQQQKQEISAKHDQDKPRGQSFPSLGRASTVSCNKI
jgi:hypothetical protein